MFIEQNLIGIKKKVLPYILIIAISILTYANSLHNQFAVDDYAYLVNCDYIKDLNNLFTIFSSDYLKVSGEQVDLNRPMMTWSLILDYSVWGLNPTGYHITNISIHAFNAVLVYLFSLLILGNPKISLLSSLIFAVHPINTEAVNGINFREDLLVTLFFLTSVILFTKGLLNQNRNRWLYIGTFFGFICALLSKEMAVTLPIVLILIHYAKTKSSIKQIVYENFPFYIIINLILIAYIYGLRFIVTNTGLPGIQVVAERAYLLIPFSGRIIFYYLKYLSFPVSLSVDHDDIEDTLSLLEPLPIAFLLSIAYICFVAARSLRTVFNTALPILWFIVTLIPVVATFYQQPLAERFLYLPSVGYSILLAAGLSWLYNNHNRRCMFFILCMLFFYTTLTISRNKFWKDDVSLFKSATNTVPDSQRAHFNLGIAYERNGNYIDAISEYKKALNKKPLAFMIIDPDKPLTNIGVIYFKMRDFDNAIVSLQSALSYAPNNLYARYHLSLAYYSKGLVNATVDELKQVIAQKADMLIARMDLANIYLDQGKYKEAGEEFKSIIKMAPYSQMAEMARKQLYAIAQKP